MASGGDGPDDLSPDWAGASLVDLSVPEQMGTSASLLDSGEDFEVLDDADEEEDLGGLPPLEDLPADKGLLPKEKQQGTTSDRLKEDSCDAVEEWLDVLGKNLFV